MKSIISLLTFASLQASAQVFELQSMTHEQLTDKGLTQVQTLATSLISNKKLSESPNACGVVLTLKGPSTKQSAPGLREWIEGIEVALGKEELAENVNLEAAPLRFREIANKVTDLADRAHLTHVPVSTKLLSEKIYDEVHKDVRDYYFLVGDYLDGERGWLSTVVVVKISAAEAVLIAHSAECY